ncbi:MAG: hypothetical protein LBJ67_06265 [Planctomycetaceae bacterium]|jgi:hypothetical protein|nr:hypothetical protein [Planctomycetaceae bacterium]
MRELTELERLEELKKLEELKDANDYAGSIRTIQWMFSEAEEKLVERFAVLCRLFLSDDPKAELAKMIMEVSDVLDARQRFATVKEYLDLCRELPARDRERYDRDLSVVKAFLAKIRDESNRPTS